MPATPDDLYAMFQELGIEYTEHRHPPLYTVAESKELRGTIPGAHCKSLFLKDRKGTLYLVVCLEHRRLDMKLLAHQLGATRLSFGKAELMWELLGVRPGAVTPFALINDRDSHRIDVVLDEEMMDSNLLNYHPLHNEATVTVTADGFVDFLRACGHNVRRLSFAEHVTEEQA